MAKANDNRNDDANADAVIVAVVLDVDVDARVNHDDHKTRCKQTRYLKFRTCISIRI